MIRNNVLEVTIIATAFFFGFTNSTSSAEPEDLLTYKPTGDELFDRYAEDCLTYVLGSHFDENPWFESESGWGQFPAAIDDEILAEWESEFGEDPRYWQLRFWCATNAWFGDKNWDKEKKEGHPERFLWEAVDRGVADAETLLILYRVLSYSRGIVSWNVNGTNLVGGSAIDEADQPLTFHERKLLRGKLANDIVEAGPDEAWAYWIRADYYFNHGEADLAFTDVSAGNNAPTNKLAVCFPFSFVLDRIEAGKHPGNELLAGAIIEAGMLDDWSYPNMSELSSWRDRLKEHQLMMALGTPNTQFDSLYRSTCLRALSGRGCRSWIKHMDALYLLVEPARGLFEDGYSGEEIVSLDFINTVIEELRAQELKRKKGFVESVPGFIAAIDITHRDRMRYSWFLHEHRYSESYDYFWLPDLPHTRERYMEQGLNAKGIYRFEKLYDFWVEENEFAKTEYHWIVERLLEFDFNTMFWPDSWPIGNWVQYPVTRCKQDLG